MNKYLPQEIQDAEVIFWSHSGGKDSQAGLAYLIRMGLKDKIVLVHADLGEMEWEEMKPWIEKTSFGLEVNVVKSDMDFFQMTRKYGRLPSGNIQFCTDFLKTQPIEAFIHDYMNKNGITKAINGTGMRASESKRRAMKKPLQVSGMFRKKNHPDHMIHDWLPIFGYSDEEVFAEIELAGQKPHELYSKGFSRLSCVFCVNGRIAEHQMASELRPELAQKVANLERELGKSYRLRQVKGVKYPRFMDEYLSGILNGVKLTEEITDNSEAC